MSNDKPFKVKNGINARYYPLSTSSLSGTSIDISSADYFTKTLSANTTFTFTNPPPSGQVGSFALEVTGTSTYTITWPASIKWHEATTPDAPANGEKDLYLFLTIDGGTTYFAKQGGDASS